MARSGSLREELFQRFQFQGQAFNFLIVVLTTLIAVWLLAMAAAAREQAVWRRRHGGSPRIPAQGSAPRR